MATLTIKFDRHSKAWLILDSEGTQYGSRIGYAQKAVALRVIKSGPKPTLYNTKD